MQPAVPRRGKFLLSLPALFGEASASPPPSLRHCSAYLAKRGFLDPLTGSSAQWSSRWSWSLMRNTAVVLLDTTDMHVADEVRELIEQPSDARLADLLVWRMA